jgi:hypothetical protein
MPGNDRARTQSAGAMGAPETADGRHAERPFDAARDKLISRWHVLAVAGLGVALRGYTAWWFDITHQADPYFHHAYVIAIVNLQGFEYYAAPYYYLVVALLSSPLAALSRFHLIDGPAFLALAAMWSNTVLLVLYAFGCMALARHLRFRPSERLIYVGLCCFVPIVERAFSFLRPENLILMLAPWATIFILICWRAMRFSVPGLRNPAFWPAVASLGVMATQKMSGLAMVGGLGILSVLLMRGPLVRRLAWLWRPATVLTVVVVLLATVHWLYSGIWFFEHPVYEPWRVNISAPLSVFTNFDPVAAWDNPFRNTHKESMWNILFIDLFGDYWEYGYANLGSEGAFGVPLEWKLYRARFGILASGVFVLLYTLSVMVLLLSALRIRGNARPDVIDERAALSGLFFLGLIIFVLSALAGLYHPGKGDIFKWEYIVMFVPFMMLPIPHLLQSTENRAARRAIAVVAVLIIVCSVLQSMWLPSPIAFGA